MAIIKLKRFHKVDHGLRIINLISFIALIFFIFISFLFSSYFSLPGITVKIPKAVTSDMVKDDNIILITAENVIYLNNNVTTLRDLETSLKVSQNQNSTLFIKANRRASVGRIMDVWNLCRKIGIEQINIATNQEN